MSAILATLVIGFGGIGVHPHHCQRGQWCTGTTYVVMQAGPARCRYRAWPPYFEPIIVDRCKHTTKAHVVRVQYGAARRTGL